MNISGVLIHSQPQHSAAIKAQLIELAGVEVHIGTDDGRLIVTVEAASDERLADTLLVVQQMTGVLSAALVYHHFLAESE